MEVFVAIVTRKLQQKSMFHSFIRIPCIPLAQSFHVKLSHWSFANVICMLRGKAFHILNSSVRVPGWSVRVGYVEDSLSSPLSSVW
jgi:hypothetical protein